ncbi:copper homeostasis protein CutC [Bacillus sp. EAC]|uniref:copper homeostasis protein CutC n=1 Tax=Bacillus sp. EAC TaxID=1978338 RepID=UPI000B450951|nr:copper homeostasis protein CutC [Bacillus sp. EAC]
MILEVIATNVKDAIDAEKFGANRLELVTGMMEGGLTPSYSTIKHVVQNVSIPVHVMIRPQSKSFIYDKYDEAVILKDIEICKELGAAGVVFGALNTDNTINEDLLVKVIQKVEGMNITFHRAIDESNDIVNSLNTLLKYPEVTHILTSGGKDSAIEGQGTINEMIKLAKNTELKIVAGSGLSIENVSNFIDSTFVEEIHFGSGVRKNHSSIEEIDENLMRNLINIIKNS